MSTERTPAERHGMKILAFLVGGGLVVAWIVGSQLPQPGTREYATKKGLEQARDAYSTGICLKEGADGRWSYELTASPDPDDRCPLTGGEFVPR